LVEALDGFAPAYYRALAGAMLGRLGVQPKGEEADAALVSAMEQALVESGVDISRFYFDWRGGSLRGPSPADTLYANDGFKAFRKAIAAYHSAVPLNHPYWSLAEPCGMLIEEVEALWQPIAELDDWTAFEIKIDAIRAMGVAMSQD
jgi:serine/tyrosine/threonine adenylyltransferase